MNTGIVIAIVLVLVGLIAFAQYNGLIRKKVAVDEAFAQIEVQLQRRNDLIPNLVETVKGYASHEQETFDKVVKARAASTAAHGVADVSAADGALTQALRGLLAVAENYPDLKASTNFLALQEELSATENKVGFARQYYNDAVRTLNTAIEVIPGKFFAGWAKATARDFYEVTDPGSREVPKVQF